MLKDNLDIILILVSAFSFILNIYNFGIYNYLKKYANIITIVVIFATMLYVIKAQFIINILLLLLLLVTFIIMFKLPVKLIYITLLIFLILSFLLSLFGVDQLVSYLGALSFLLFASIIFRSFFNENSY